MVTEPHAVTEALRQMNDEKYAATSNTPLMIDPLLNDFGYLGERQAADEVLQGTYTYPEGTSQETREMLSALRRPQAIEDLPIMVTETQYREAWSRVKEKKSSSHSGRHFGVYKAVTQDDQLLTIFTNAFNIPFVHGISYDRWSNFLDVMTFKEKGNIRVDKLRTLILGEADWNMGGRIHINRRMLQNAEKHDLIPEEHYGGRHGHKATDAVLTKRLTLDTFRLNKQPAAVTSTDVANCYDRMVHSYITMSARRLGTQMAVLTALLRPLQESRHYIRTAFGDSTTFYGGKRRVPYQGSGQGNASSSPFWLIVSAPLIQLLTANNVCASFTSAITLATIALTMVMYVDDNDIYVTSSRTNKTTDVICQSQHNLRTWKRLLEVTGGVVRPKKCSWALVAFKWHGGDYFYCDSTDHPATLYLEDDNGVDTPLDRIEPHTGVKSLGVYTQIDGYEDEEMKYLQGKINDWSAMIQHSPLPATMNLQSMFARITRTIMYPLPATTFDRAQCRELEAAMYRTSLPKCGVSSKLPFAIRYSPPCYMGLGISEVYINQGIQHVAELITHYDKPTTSGTQLKLHFELARLIIGSE